MSKIFERVPQFGRQAITTTFYVITDFTNGMPSTTRSQKFPAWFCLLCGYRLAD